MRSVFILAATLTLAVNANAKDLKLAYVLAMAEANSKQLSAAKLQEIVAQKSYDIAMAGYYPKVNLESIYTRGFAGSSGDLGITGVMGSPYRDGGIASGASARQIIWDFGQTSRSVEASSYEAEVARQDTKVTLSQVKLLALQKFYECSLFQSQYKLWESLGQESAEITKEVEHFVNTGQYSIVDKYLSQAETQHTLSAKAFYSEHLKRVKRELAIIMGVNGEKFSCPMLPHITHLPTTAGSTIEASPIILQAGANANLAQKQAKAEEAKAYPQVIAVASYGHIHKARVVEKKRYAAGIGLNFPILDATTSAQIKKAQAVAMARSKEVESARQYIEETNATYDENIQATLVLLKQLATELKIVNDGFTTAKKRYYNFEGTLIDLREAFRNLVRVKTAIEDSRAKILELKGAKALLNGITLEN
jgi:outer membrane protein